MRIEQMKAQLSDYGLDHVTLEVVQGANGLDVESVRGMIKSENKKTLLAQGQLAESEHKVKALSDSIATYLRTNAVSRTILPELRTLYPDVVSLSTGSGVVSYVEDSVAGDSEVFLVNVVLNKRIKADDEARMRAWLKARLLRDDVVISTTQLRK